MRPYHEGMGAPAIGRGLATGVAAWTLTEYAVHRWVMHGPQTTNPLTAEHLDHHRHLERTDPLGLDRFLAWPATSGVLVAAVAARLTSTPVALAAGTGFAASYCGYRHLHWCIHHRAPRTSWGRRLRRDHFRHHIGAPRRNHGVTTSLWDRLLGTYRDDDAPVSLPAAMAPRWLLHDDGRLRAELAPHFTLR